MATTHAEVVTPAGVLYSGDAEQVLCRSEGGEIAFLADHMPFLGALEAGQVRVDPEVGDSIHMAARSGFVEVRNNRVIILADVAEKAADIDVTDAQAAKEAAEQKISKAGGEGEAPDAEADLRWAEVRLEVAGA